MNPLQRIMACTMYRHLRYPFAVGSSGSVLIVLVVKKMEHKDNNVINIFTYLTGRLR
jgi:hypothetical protein